MPEDVQIGYGTTFAYSTDDGANYTPLAKIIGHTPPKPTVAKVSTDSFDSPVTVGGAPVEDQIPGWVSPGTYALKLWHQKTQYAALYALLAVPGVKFKVIKPDGSGYTFTGYLSEVGDETPLKEGMSYDVTFQITGGVAEFSTSLA